MNANSKRAFEKLKEIGAPVLGPEMGWSGHFSISAEKYGRDDGFYKGHIDEDPDGNDWADYYNYGFGEFGVSPHITAVLDKYGLYCEWVNPAILSVFDA